MEAFFGCLYYAALRPAEAVALREADCILPARGWGRIDPAASQLRAEHGVAVLLKVYASCIEGQAGLPNQRINEHVGVAQAGTVGGRCGRAARAR